MCKKDYVDMVDNRFLETCSQTRVDHFIRNISKHTSDLGREPALKISDQTSKFCKCVGK